MNPLTKGGNLLFNPSPAGSRSTQSFPSISKDQPISLHFLISSSFSATRRTYLETTHSSNGSLASAALLSITPRAVASDTGVR